MTKLIAPLYFIASALFFLVSQGNPSSIVPGILAVMLLLIGFFGWFRD